VGQAVAVIVVMAGHGPRFRNLKLPEYGHQFFVESQG